MFLALTEFILVRFVTLKFEKDTLTLLSVVFRLPSITGVFLGAALAVQPLVGTLCGEGNTWGLRAVMKEVARSMFWIGIVLSLFTVLFAPFLVRAFGIKDGTLLRQGSVMLRCMGLSLVFQAFDILFFVYYYLIQKNNLSLLIIALKEFVMPVTLVLLGVRITGSPVGLWAGLALAPAVSLFISMLTVLLLYGKDFFPWLVSGDRDRLIRCYDFEINEENAVRLSETMIDLLGRQGYSRESVLLAGVLEEDYFMLIKEINPPGKKIDAECCVIMEENGIRIVFRDSGIVFDVAQDGGTGSLRDYVFSQVVTMPEYNVYLMTTGYNRIELQLAR